MNHLKIQKIYNLKKLILIKKLRKNLLIKFNIVKFNKKYLMMN
jgi:hypothetical protein